MSVRVLAIRKEATCSPSSPRKYHDVKYYGLETNSVQNITVFILMPGSAMGAQYRPSESWWY